MIHKDNPPIGSRFVCEGSYGTVRYVGEVPPTKGLWLGVEWDDPERGKHNGTHDGHTYFSTKYPTSGSFVRPKKVVFGVTYNKALQERYGKVEDGIAGIIQEDMFVFGRKNQLTEVEVFGMESLNEKQSKFDQLLEVAIRESYIYGMGIDKEILTRNIAELDLSKNLIPSWEEVAKITEKLTALKILVVSDNQLQMPSDPEALSPAFSSIQTLLANRMDMNWQEVMLCSKMWPKLEQLHVCFNGIKELSYPPNNSTFQTITLLNLEGNKLNGWKEVNQLGNLSSLETLILINTGLETILISEDPCELKTQSFPCLKEIVLNENNISQWSSINELNKLQSLKDIKFVRNPLLDNITPQTARQWMIARIKNLKSCNRTEVIPEERKGAEIDYLKKNGQEWKDAGGHQESDKNHPSRQFMCNHPRYEELLKAWGAPEDSEMKQQSNALKHSLLSLSIYSPLIPERVPYTKKLPATMTVQKLKTLVKRLFKLDSSDFRLSYISKKMPGPEIELDSDLRQLSFYAIENEDTISARW